MAGVQAPDMVVLYQQPEVLMMVRMLVDSLDLLLMP